uniref:Multidrug resistance-associated protein 4 n=1 Tax=Lygus hesperus TaxID=30085 RepID=A0A0A9Z9T5_LYGHE
MLFTGTIRFNLDPEAVPLEGGVQPLFGKEYTEAIRRSSEQQQSYTSTYVIQELVSDPVDGRYWEALQRVQLLHTVYNLPRKLDTVVYGGSSIENSFSSGQAQLLCIARALLRTTQILFLDEATAPVDRTTDAFLQEILRKEFQNRTVVTIAHRLDTILDYDRVAVISAGRVVELGTPAQLVKDTESYFYKLYREIDSG